MIKILQIGFGHKVGGIQNCLLNFYKNMDRDLIRFDFINMTGHKFYYEDDIRELGGKIYNVPNEIKYPIRCYKRIKEIIEDNKYDIVHVNKNSLACFVAITAVKNSNTKIRIIHSHSTKSNGGLIGNTVHYLNKIILERYFNYYFACSTEAAKWMFNKKIINSKQFYIINNAIDVKNYMYNSSIRNKVRRELGIEKNEIVIGHVGRFVPVKNHKFLIDMYKQLLSKNKKYRLLLVGDGDLYNEIVEYSKKNKVFNRIIFLGNRRDVNNIYQAMDIFVLPSFHEGLPIVGVEAQCSGLPCIFSDKVTRDVKIQDNTEYLPINDNISIWTDYILKLSLKDRKKNNKMIDSAFNIEKESKKLEELYIKFLKDIK